MVNRAHKSRESAGLGIANILAGCYGGIAGCAMIGQTIVNVEMGRARSRLSTVIAGLVLLLLVNVVFLIAGCFLDGSSAYYIFMPVVLPILQALNVDLVQAGVFITVNLAIGLVTPPVGLCLLLCNQTGETRLSHSLKAMMPMLLISIIVLFLITYVSPLTTLLPSIMAG